MKNVAKIILTFMIAILVSFTNIANAVPMHNQATAIQAATTGQANALLKAKAYLQIQPFSKKGLIKQLKFDGFTEKEAKYGVKKAGY